VDDSDLVRELNFLGVDRHTWPALALLPLIQVAWADGAVQEAERALILSVADREARIDAIGRRLLESWLTHAPTEQYLRRGREAARLLAEREPDVARAETVLEHAHAVARAAGGLFGFGRVDAREQAVLDELAEALSVPPEQRWGWMDDLDDDDDDDDDEAPVSAVARVVMAPAIEVIEMEEADFRAESLDAPTIQCTFQPAEAPQPGAPELERLDTDARYPMPPGGLSIGRARTNDLWVRDDAKVSRRHCRLSFEGDAIWVTDNASTTGTFVNEERVVQRQLFGGEALAVGDLLFRFHRRGTSVV
jgi:tellurite resistance protein